MEIKINYSDNYLDNLITFKTNLILVEINNLDCSTSIKQGVLKDIITILENDN